MTDQVSTLNYLQSKLGEVICLKLKNGRTVFGKMTEVTDKSEVVQISGNTRTTKGENFEVLIDAPIELIVTIMPTQAGPSPMEVPVPYFTVAPSESIPFMKDELSMFALATKDLTDMWVAQTTPIDTQTKIQLP